MTNETLQVLSYLMDWLIFFSFWGGLLIGGGFCMRDEYRRMTRLEESVKGLPPPDEGDDPLLFLEKYSSDRLL